MARSQRSNDIKRRRSRQRKLAYLRKRYANARTDGERNALLGKVKRVSPSVTAEAFIALVPRKATGKAARA